MGARDADGALGWSFKADSGYYPTAVDTIVLPDGGRLKYHYDPPPPAQGLSETSIQRLVNVDRLRSDDVTIESVTYLYENAQFPTYITGIIDARGVRIATYAYDSAGRVTLTVGAGGADRYMIEYIESGDSRIRRVINALGKIIVYRFRVYNPNYSSDVRLVGVDGEASLNCTAGSRSNTYNASKFIAAAVDEEGRQMTYERDGRGRPLKIIRGQ